MQHYQQNGICTPNSVLKLQHFSFTNLTQVLLSPSHATTPILSTASLVIFTGCMCALLPRNMCLPSSEREREREVTARKGAKIILYSQAQMIRRRALKGEVQPPTGHLPLEVPSLVTDTQRSSCHTPMAPFLLITLKFFVSCGPTLISTQPLTRIRRLQFYSNPQCFLIC